MSEHDPSCDPAKRRDAILSFMVNGPDSATVVVAVEHRDPGETWLPAGSLSMIAPSESSLRVGGLKEEFRFGAPSRVIFRRRG